MKLFAVLVFMLNFSPVICAQNRANAILGEWVSPQKNSRIVIYSKGTKYFGKITWGSGQLSRDEKNPDRSLRSRNLIGLENLKNFEFNGAYTWQNGTIYDPREGKTYSCTITLKSATQLSIRGYIGIPLLGRTEIWTRY